MHWYDLLLVWNFFGEITKFQEEEKKPLLGIHHKIGKKKHWCEHQKSRGKRSK
jgi:hypothetical protein